MNIDKAENIWLYGWHTVFAVVQEQPDRVRQVLLAPGKDSVQRHSLLVHLEKTKIQVSQVSHADFEKQIGEAGATHQGVAVLCAQTQIASEGALFESLLHWQEPTLLVLDRVQDPRNLGACLRVAQAVGCKGVIIEKHQSAPLSAVAMKAACGSLISLYQVTNLVRVLQKLKKCGIWIYGADSEAASSLFEESISHSCAWVIGNESKGLRPLVQQSCDIHVRIPMQGGGASLNASVAAAICLFESYRQTQKLGDQ